MAINKLNRQNWNNITIHKIKLEDAQNRIDSYFQPFCPFSPLKTGSYEPKGTRGPAEGLADPLSKIKNRIKGVIIHWPWI